DDLTYLHIRRFVRSGRASAVRPPVQLALPDEAGFPHQGTIDFVDNQVDAGTGTMKLRGVFPNADRQLTPGLFVRVRLPLGRPHPAVLIPERAVETDQGQKVVYAVGKDDVVRKRAVKLGGLHGGLREVVEGLEAGERVVTDGLQRVRDGAAVVP